MRVGSQKSQSDTQLRGGLCLLLALFTLMFGGTSFSHAQSCQSVRVCVANEKREVPIGQLSELLQFQGAYEGSCSGPLTDLVAYYPFDQDILDYSGNGNHGSLQGSPSTPTFGVAKQGNGIYLSGSNHVVVSESPTLNSITEELTVVGWVKLTLPPQLETSLSRQGAAIVMREAAGSGSRWYLHALSAAYLFGLSRSGNYTDANLMSGYTIQDTYGPNGMWQSRTIAENTRWIHLAAVYTGSHMILYRNGIEASRDSWSGIRFEESLGRLRIGGMAGDGSMVLPGDPLTIDELRIYNRALSLAEINELRGMATTPAGRGTDSLECLNENPAATFVWLCRKIGSSFTPGQWTRPQVRIAFSSPTFACGSCPHFAP